MAGDASRNDPEPAQHPPSLRSWIAVLLLIAGFTWAYYARQQGSPSEPTLPPEAVQALTSGSVASMDSPALFYSDGWRMTRTGADPPEPADPWLEPSGVLTFTYSGAELALNLAVGDYWSYVYVTVDGEPANLLPYIRGNDDCSRRTRRLSNLLCARKTGGGIPQPRVGDGYMPSATQRLPTKLALKSGVDGAKPPFGQSPSMPCPGRPCPSGPASRSCCSHWPCSVPSVQTAARSSADSRTVAQMRQRLAWLLLPGLSQRSRLLLPAPSSCLPPRRHQARPGC